jgi:SAM-dependent methyltransferase
VRGITAALSGALDRAYLRLDRRRQRRTRSLRLVPDLAHRRGGKLGYGEWCWAIGLFQALLHAQLPRGRAPQILDVGCGTGLLAIACEPLLGAGGRYLGLDVSRRDIEFCRAHYPTPPFAFELLEARNAAYAPERAAERVAWGVADASVDLVTALSVWTHFAEADALFYLAEVGRVLRPGGRAILTCFLLDAAARAAPLRAPGGESCYHATDPARWVFDVPARGSREWLHPAWARAPEDAIAFTEAALARMLEASGLRELARHPGTWREAPGLYFQDVLVLMRDG